MLLLRSLAFLAVLFVSIVLFSIPLSLFGWFLPYGWIARAGRSWGRLNLLALEKICGLGYRIHGWENLPETTSIRPIFT